MTDITGLERELDKFMDDYADFVFQKAQENLVQNGSVDTAELLRSGIVEREFLEKKIVWDAPHADFVEFGIPPTSVPAGPLIKWAKRKLGKKNKEARRIGWAVRSKIAKQGIDPKPFVRPAVDEARVRFLI